MKRYIGIKLVNAEPMNRLAYNEFRGWELPEDEKGDDAGFLVEYLDGGQANTDAYDGYVSWSPAAVFANAYSETVGMNFGMAIDAMKKGEKVARSGWNGKGMFIFYVDNAPGFAPFIAINTGSEVRPWLASQADMLADDWRII